MLETLLKTPLGALFCRLRGAARLAVRHDDVALTAAAGELGNSRIPSPRGWPSILARSADRSGGVERTGGRPWLGREGHSLWRTGTCSRVLGVLFSCGNWQLARQGVDFQIIGLYGTVEQPSVVASLRRNILHYIYTEAFRGTDSPIRTLLKRCALCLPSWLTWHGPLVLITSVNPVVFDRFVLMTEDREIAFLFRSGETTPFAVCKRGDPEALAAERRNHERALQLLGDSVPALLKDVGNGSRG